MHWNEQPACLEGQFECLPGHCIEQKLRCDGVYHCNNQKDEKNCPPKIPGNKIYFILNWDFFK